MKRNKKMLTEMDCYLFGLGRHYEIYEKMGAHVISAGGQKGVYFAVWAPDVQSVHVVGDFNEWKMDAPMTLIPENGIWETFIPGLEEGCVYKYAITMENGRILEKADPYANYAELRPKTASIAADLSYKWSDRSWMMKRKKRQTEQEAMSIYEVHPGSWKKKTQGEVQSQEQEFYNYRELADELGDYILSMGYTHVELMGIAEYPFDGSWGYQVTGYYAPTSRYGTPKDFMYFVEQMHKKGIGVILDWVPAHFPKDAHGLAEFNGSPLYEYADTRKGEHADWGTKVFDYGKNQVINFLLANALFWVEKYHIDGLRVDAVASMLYLDYGRQPGCWVPNERGGNENLEAIEFFKHLNSIIIQRNPGVMTIAEESTAWPLVTKAPEKGGLGFTFKWNMGWMHDFLEYMSLDPLYRKYNHNKMTFSMTYMFYENYVLVLSHDEVVHLKKSMFGKMPGNAQNKLNQLKTAYTFMIGHPGKKLLFMGQEFGQKEEWDENKSLDWALLDDPNHKNLQKYTADLMNIYKTYPACYEWDQDWDGFEWINADDAEFSIFSFIRRNPSKKKNLIFVCNFTPVMREGYRIGLPSKGKYRLILDTVHGRYEKNKRPVLEAEKRSWNGKHYSAALYVDGFASYIFEYDE